MAAPLNLRAWPAVVAHRGASAHHPENTLDAFEAAVAVGADIVELDVRRTPDGGLVVTHDVIELTLPEMRRLQPDIPTLDEALELLLDRVALEVEIKNDPGEAGYEPSGTTVARDVVAAVRRHAFTDVFISSFDAECLLTVKDLDRGLATGLLVEPSFDLECALDIAAVRHAFLLPEATALENAGGAFIERAHERDVRICTWTVDDPAEIARLFELGVDAVETNDPALGVSVRDSPCGE